MVREVEDGFVIRLTQVEKLLGVMMILQTRWLGRQQGYRRGGRGTDKAEEVLPAGRFWRYLRFLLERLGWLSDLDRLVSQLILQVERDLGRTENVVALKLISRSRNRHIGPDVPRRHSHYRIPCHTPSTRCWIC